VLSQAITLSSPGSKVLARAVLWGRCTSIWGAAIFRGAACIQAQAVVIDGANTLGNWITMSLLDSPGSIGPHTYSVRAGSNDAAFVLRLNGTTTARLLGGASRCTLTLLEIG
jgi:hypothetical protein